jgi:hypothetical protein
MRIQGILDQPNTLNLGLVFGKEVWPECRLISRGSSGSHCHIAPPCRRRKGQQDTAGSMLLLFIMVAFRLARTQREERANLANEKAEPFLTTKQRPQGLRRESLRVKYICHGPDIIPSDVADAPWFAAPRL